MKTKHLPRAMKNLVVIGVIIISTLSSLSLKAITFTAMSTGNWEDGTTWDQGGAIPGSTDDVVIDWWRTVTINSNVTCNNLQIGSASQDYAKGFIVVSSTFLLTVNGNLIIGGSGTIGNEGTLTLASDAMVLVNGITQIGSPTSVGGNGTIIFGSNSIFTASGAIVIGFGTGPTGSTGSLNFTDGGTLVIKSSITVNFLGAFTAGAGTVIYDGSDQTVAPNTLGIYNNLTLSGTGLKTTTDVSFNGLLSMEGFATASDPITAGSVGTIQYKGLSSQTSGPEFGAISGIPLTRSFGGSGGVIIDNVNGVSMASNCDITSTLTLITGDFNIRSNYLSVYRQAITGK